MSIGFSDGSMSEDWGQYYSGGTKASTMPDAATEKPAGEFKVDRAHNVPLIASYTPDGIAIDHRVDTQMEFEGRKHDITPFLVAHENAERVMDGMVKGGMNARDAYELAHDKVANPAEAAVRNTYALENGLDVDKFNDSYWAHIETQKGVAKQPSDKEKHPDAHTTIYDLDPPDPDEKIHQYEDDFSTK